MNDQGNSSITTNIYRKANHTDQYLQLTSNHPVHQKLGIMRMLMHHAETLIKDEGRVKIETEKVSVALKNCGKRQKRREE